MVKEELEGLKVFPKRAGADVTIPSRLAIALPPLIGLSLENHVSQRQFAG
jgi:hypothetical protein